MPEDNQTLAAATEVGYLGAVNEIINFINVEFPCGITIDTLLSKLRLMNQESKRTSDRLVSLALQMELKK